MTGVPPCRLIVLCQDIPYPPRHGGQVETWTRLQAWRELGVALHVVFWSTAGEQPQPAVEALESLGCTVTPLPRRRTVRSILQTAVPPLAFSMRPREAWYRPLVKALAQFDANGIVLENWPGVLTAFALGRELQVPVLYRSQNLETEYWKEIHGAARGLGRVRLGFTARRIERLERAVREAASLVLEISSDDARGAEAAGMRGKSVILPPVWRAGDRLLDGGAKSATEVDVMFGGSLWPPHHVEGVRWLLTQVLPLLRERHGRGLSMRIVGARPAAELLRLAMDCGVEVRADVHDFAGELRKARVLVNPVQRSSGINMKMLDLLSSGASVVSTTPGVRGLSERVKALSVIADTPVAFAAAIGAALERPQTEAVAATVPTVAEEYGVNAQREVLRDVCAGRLGLAGRLSM